jgi:hypothetical protein
MYLGLNSQKNGCLTVRRSHNYENKFDGIEAYISMKSWTKIIWKNFPTFVLESCAKNQGDGATCTFCSNCDVREINPKSHESKS